MSDAANPLKEYYIAYFDILGYRNFFIENPDNVKDFLQNIHKCFADFDVRTKQTNLNFNKFSASELSYRIFSDNILICIELPNGVKDNLGFLSYLKIVASIQDLFINEYGIFIRGGVTIGELSFNKEYIFGSGLVRAVELENRAKSPRIIVDEKLLTFLADIDKIDSIETKTMVDAVTEKYKKEPNSLNDEQFKLSGQLINEYAFQLMFKKLKVSIMKYDADGEWYVSYLDEMVLDTLYIEAVENGISYNKSILTDDLIKNYYNNKDQMIQKTREYCKNRIDQHKTRLYEKIKRYGNYTDIKLSDRDAVKQIEEREKVICKYKWVLDYHNSICLQYKYPECFIEYEIDNLAIILHNVIRVIGIHITSDKNNVIEQVKE